MDVLVFVAVVVDAGSGISSAAVGVSVVDIAMYSVSLTPKFPLTPSKCRSSTFSIICLQYEILSFVISVINLNIVPLVFFASNIALFIGSNEKGAMENHGVKSPNI